MKKILLLFVLLSLNYSTFGSLIPSGQSKIFINQLGYLPGHSKIAIVNSSAEEFTIKTADKDSVVFRGKLSKPRYWEFSGESVKAADFSGFDQEGIYKITVIETDSYPFRISKNVYDEISKSAIRKFYFSRASVSLEKKYAGKWERPAGHPDTLVFVHACAADKNRPEGFIISSPKGWYDAGDYNKYIVNSGITTYTLLLMYEMHPEYFDKLKLNIPESDNDIPDLLDEVRWNLDWMLSMQDPNDGGVYHKLTSKEFSPFIMPHQDTSARYVVMKTTCAALDFSAVMAQAARVYKKYDVRFSEKCLDASVSAWKWAYKNRDVYYNAPKDIVTGEYRGKSNTDEFVWAAIELFISTGNQSYLQNIDLENIKYETPSWAKVDVLGVISLLNSDKAIESKNSISKKFKQFIDTLAIKLENSAYKISNEKFEWGSNSEILNQSLLLISAYKIYKERKYLEAAILNTDYILGRNPLNQCFVTGFGEKSPLHVHDRISEADGVYEPIPGMVVGGANPYFLTDCGKEKYNSLLPALCYLDDVCSYSTNEIAINWNAPLAFVLSMLNIIK